MPDMTTTRTVDKELPCRLTDDEQRLRGIELSEVNTKHIELQEEKKEAAKSFKEQIDATNKRIVKLKDAVKNGVEQRKVECEVTYDYVAGTVTIVRQDTLDMVEKRAMTPAESQGKMDLDGGGE